MWPGNIRRTMGLMHLLISTALVLLGMSRPSSTFKFETGLCPSMPVASKFNPDKFFGLWYVIQMTNTATRCYTMDFSSGKKGSDFKVQIDKEIWGLSAAGIYNHASYTAEGYSAGAKGAQMVLVLPTAAFGEIALQVVDVDYNSWALLWACKWSMFGHLEAAIILSRSTGINSGTLQSLRKIISDNGVDVSSLATVQHSQCKSGGGTKFTLEFDPASDKTKLNFDSIMDAGSSGGGGGGAGGGGGGGLNPCIEEGEYYYYYHEDCPSDVQDPIYMTLDEFENGGTGSYDYPCFFVNADYYWEYSDSCPSDAEYSITVDEYYDLYGDLTNYDYYDYYDYGDGDYYYGDYYDYYNYDTKVGDNDTYGYDYYGDYYYDDYYGDYYDYYDDYYGDYYGDYSARFEGRRCIVVEDEDPVIYDDCPRNLLDYAYLAEDYYAYEDFAGEPCYVYKDKEYQYYDQCPDGVDGAIPVSFVDSATARMGRQPLGGEASKKKERKEKRKDMRKAVRKMRRQNKNRKGSKQTKDGSNSKKESGKEDKNKNKDKNKNGKEKDKKKKGKKKDKKDKKGKDEDKNKNEKKKGKNKGGKKDNKNKNGKQKRPSYEKYAPKSRSEIDDLEKIKKPRGQALLRLIENSAEVQELLKKAGVDWERLPKPITLTKLRGLVGNPKKWREIREVLVPNRVSKGWQRRLDKPQGRELWNMVTMNPRLVSLLKEANVKVKGNPEDFTYNGLREEVKKEGGNWRKISSVIMSLRVRKENRKSAKNKGEGKGNGKREGKNQGGGGGKRSGRKGKGGKKGKLSLKEILLGSQEILDILREEGISVEGLLDDIRLSDLKDMISNKKNFKLIRELVREKKAGKGKDKPKKKNNVLKELLLESPEIVILLLTEGISVEGLDDNIKLSDLKDMIKNSNLFQTIKKYILEKKGKDKKSKSERQDKGKVDQEEDGRDSGSLVKRRISLKAILSKLPEMTEMLRDQGISLEGLPDNVKLSDLREMIKDNETFRVIKDSVKNAVVKGATRRDDERKGGQEDNGKGERERGDKNKEKDKQGEKGAKEKNDEKGAKKQDGKDNKDAKNRDVKDQKGAKNKDDEKGNKNKTDDKGTKNKDEKNERGTKKRDRKDENDVKNKNDEKGTKKKKEERDKKDEKNKDGEKGSKDKDNKNAANNNNNKNKKDNKQRNDNDKNDFVKEYVSTSKKKERGKEEKNDKNVNKEKDDGVKGKGKSKRDKDETNYKQNKEDRKKDKEKDEKDKDKGKDKDKDKGKDKDKDKKNEEEKNDKNNKNKRNHEAHK